MPLTITQKEDFDNYLLQSTTLAEQRLVPFLRSPENQEKLTELLTTLSVCSILIPGAGIAPGLKFLLRTIRAINAGIFIKITCFDNTPDLQKYTEKFVLPQLRSEFLNIKLEYIIITGLSAIVGKFDIVYLEHPLSLSLENWRFSENPDNYRLLFPCLMNALKNNVLFINCNFFNTERNATKALIESIIPAEAKRAFTFGPGNINFASLTPYKCLSTMSVQQSRSVVYSQKAMNSLVKDIVSYDELKKFLIGMTVILFIFSPSKTETWSAFFAFLAQYATLYFQLFIPGVRIKDIIYDFLLFLLQIGIFLMATGSLTSLVFEE